MEESSGMKNRQDKHEEIKKNPLLILLRWLGGDKFLISNALAIGTYRVIPRNVDSSYK